MAAPMSASQLLDAGIDALARADAAQLERLASAAGHVRFPSAAEEDSAAERKLARERLRTLGQLIVLTRRNLRLLQGAGDGVYGPSGNRSRP